MRRMLMVGAAVVVCAAGVVTAAAAGPSQPPGPAAVACSPDTTRQTTNGPVCGIVAKSADEWLGIRYAAPPVGALRWAAPQPPQPWTATLPTTAYGNQCAQSYWGTASGNEDCLFLDVTRPNDGAANLPVLVHFHGGGFVSLSGRGDYTLLAYTGHAVVVSMNYRLGIFGFLANAGLGEHAGDWGLQDQQAALRWVRDNIEQLGGDPHNVTIFGESAGASSVCDAIASPTAKGLFQRAISEGGEYNTLLGSPTNLETQDCKSDLPSQVEANAAGADYAQIVGCPVASQVAECLRSLTVAQAETGVPYGYQFGGTGTVGPTINGTTLTQSLRQALRTGAVNKVPLIAGSGRDENLVGDVTTAEQYSELVDTQYGRYANQVLARYPLSRFGSPAIAFRTVSADSNTVCASLRVNAEVARWMPVYVYEIDDNDIPPYVAADASGSAPGAQHVRAWYLTPSTPALDANQQALQNEELASVAQFARNGNPVAYGTPLWPRYDRSGHGEVLSLQPAGDSELVTTDQLAAQHNCAFWDRLAPKPGELR
ncbi:MAG TPA: carboxylesterase family protein [Jatrophihabitantaceae bacterium]